ncbi:hypothetical protein HIM_10348 [Hirsutella minnesotensis 3608]|uniref:Major facilitator superfamily (MFS) profile domain-containing protein n=1 Tax=Hirsutella minnesotensis 3608 TaxID=1043627 RepID=A0A0F7ZX82_9HYPO|nr:hypothetical protein HIM_10348 [Hirsutella minnesotensis 3608]
MKQWPRGRKRAATNVLSATGFNRILVSTIRAPALSIIADRFDMTAPGTAMALSIYVLVTAVGPLLAGPLTELYGRQVVLHISNIWFLAWNITCGFANSKEILITARFLTSLGASAILALAIMVGFCFCIFRETYALVILKRRAERLRRDAVGGADNYETPEERLGRQTSLSSTFSCALSRPLRLLTTHPIIQSEGLLLRR